MTRYTFALLWIFVFFMPWERNIGIPVFGAAGTPVGILAILLGSYSVIASGKLKLRPPSLFLLVMALSVLWSGVGYFWSISPSTTLTRSITFSQLLIMVWLVWQFCRSEQERSALLQAYVFGAYAAIVVMLIDFASGAAYSSSGRYSFAGGDPNYLATTLALGIPMAWHLLTSRKSDLLYWLNLLYVPLAIFAIGLTGSRGGTLTALVALSIIPLTYWRLSFLRKTLMLAMLGAMVYSAFVLIPQANLERLLTASDQIAEGTVSGRGDIWRAGLEVLGENSTASIVGVGSGGFGAAIEPIFGSARASHNAFLSVLLGNGLIGLLLFVSLFIIAVVPMLQLRPPLRTFYLVLWLTLIIGLIPVNWEYHKATWFVLAILTTQRAFVVTLPKTWKHEKSEVALQGGHNYGKY